jgi:hypothetical protein
VGAETPLLKEVLYEPGPYPQAMSFRNIRLHSQSQGGEIRMGWIFYIDTAKALPHQPAYLCVAHHAVWQTMDNFLVDITPHDESFPPLMNSEGYILFLLDDHARPQTDLALALPTRFYPLTEDPALIDFVEQLNLQEQVYCNRCYERAPLGLVQLEC